jgi:hypothetical protein
VHLNSATPNTVELKRISGRTVKQFIQYGDGTSATNWGAAGGTIGTSGGSLISTGDGSSSDTVAIYSSSVSLSVSKRYYAQIKVRVTNAVCSAINVYYDGTTAGTNKNVKAQATPTENQWYTLSINDTLPADATGNVKLLIAQVYANAGAASGKVMEIDYAMMIDLTELSVAHLTTTAEVEAYFGITGYVPFGLTNSIPTAVVTSLASYAVANSEWPTDQQTYGIPCLPCGVCDYIDGHTSIYWRNVGIALFDGDGGETWALAETNTNVLKFRYSIGAGNHLCGAADTTTALSSHFVQKDIYTAYDYEGFTLHVNGYLYVSVLKTRIGWASGDDASKVTAFKAWLTTNNLQVQYYRTATDHALTSATISTFRVNSATTDTISITGALNPTTCFDLGDYYSHYTSLATIGALMSLPDGTKDNYISFVDKVANSATFQQRVTRRTNTALRLDLPIGAVSGGWELGKVGTTAARFFLKLEDQTGASGHTILGATRCYRANLPTATAWEVVVEGDFTFRTALPAGLETWATSATPTILFKNSALALNTFDYYTAKTADCAAIDSTSGYLYVYVEGGNLIDLSDLYTWLGTNPISVVIPYDTYGDEVENIHQSSLAYQLSTSIAHTADAASICYYEDYDNSTHYISLKLPVATADTLAELYTYLTANPLSVIVPITAETESKTTIYIPQSGDNAMTLALKSSTVALEGDFSAVYCKDTTLVYNALEARIAALE